MYMQIIQTVLLDEHILDINLFAMKGNTYLTIKDGT